ncbi:hypothetical protein EVAR_12700_1 [Eumeta japonica]|uniref:Uncharacterized protein n=1 Tax=Eumeta variegata TaxID=151549 RepID=A0A4C1UNV2_EUMVA|nr:hypothetical protein EVAR_12700_1 [Eumeta japonica]
MELIQCKYDVFKFDYVKKQYGWRYAVVIKVEKDMYKRFYHLERINENAFTKEIYRVEMPITGNVNMRMRPPLTTPHPGIALSHRSRTWPLVKKVIIRLQSTLHETGWLKFGLHLKLVYGTI